MPHGRSIRLEAPEHPGVVRFLTGLPVSLGESAPGTATWVTVTRMGTFRDARYGEFSITREMLLAMVSNFERRTYGQDVFVDVAHRPENGAAGKVVKLEVSGDRLRALVEWTPFGIEAIRDRGYQYLSAEYHENWRDNEAGNAHGPVLLGAGLTVRPVIKGLDPVLLAESTGAGDVPVLVHPTLQLQLTQEIHAMWKQLSDQLKATLLAVLTLSEPIRQQIFAAWETAVKPVTDEAAAKALMEHYGTLGKQLGEQLKGIPGTIKLDIPAPAITAGLSADDVRKLLAEEKAAGEAAAKQLADSLAGNRKVLSDAIAAAQGLDDVLKRELTEQVADLVTASMSADQIKRLADTQIANGNKIVAARRLAALGFQTPNGTVHISVDSTNEVRALQESVDRRLGFDRLSDAQRYRATGGQLQAVNKDFAERVLAQYDAQNGQRLHAEHKLLAGGDSLVSDVAIPAIFERTVIREALYQLVALNLVDLGTLPFSGTGQLPYSYRDTAAAGRSAVRKYEGQSISRAAVKQALETFYAIPQKIAFEVSDELRYLTANGQIQFDAVAENVRNASRIIAEDTEKMIGDELLQACDEYSTTAVVSEAVATANGTNKIFVLDNFPVVRPRKFYDLQGTQVGSTLYPITITVNAVAISEYDGTGTQGAGTYYSLNHNLGEITFVNQAGTPVAPTNTHAIVASYTYSTNVYKFDTDLGSLAVDAKWDDFLYRFGLRKSVIEDQRYYMANVGVMSGTVRTQIEQARQFAANYKRAGTDLTNEGNLGAIKGVPSFKIVAPGLNLADARVLVGERAQTRFRMMKPWAMGQLENQKDANGRFTGKKEAYGDQWVVCMTPTQLKGAMTSMVLYGAAARVDRAS